MARPMKQGLDYFPLDVDIDQDDKFQLIEALHGITGFGATIKLMMRIYKEGYYYNWTEMEQILFAKRVDVDINSVQNIVSDCIKYGVFDQGMFEQHQILTSRGIQLRYFEAVTRRKSVEADESYLLVNAENYPNVNRTIVNVDINPKSVVVNEDISTQSKGKERKVEESKSPKRVYDESSQFFILADYMYKQILNNNPNHKMPNMQTWSNTFRLLVEADKRDIKEVSELIQWVQKDDFEMSNVLSPSKLRKRYDQLKMKMVRQSAGASKTSNKGVDWDNL